MLQFKNHFDTSLVDPLILERGFETVKREADGDQVGYYNLPIQSQAFVAEATILRDEIDKEFNTIAVIGIGGSSLGIKAIERLLRPSTHESKKIIYLENSDPVSIQHELSVIDPKKTLFIIVSKSGGTVETLSIFKCLIVTFDLLVKDSKQILVISDEDSILSRFADENHLRRFVIPHNVGGRFSVLSAVGIVPLTLAGFDTQKLLSGAQTFLENFWNRKEDHLLEKSAYYVSNAEHFPINVLFAYSDMFGEFGKWMVQLWGESLGKRNRNGERVGLTPIALIGSVDQHSFLQLIIDGPLNKTVTFMHIAQSKENLMIPELSLKYLEKSDFLNNHSFNELINAQCMATMQSVVENGVGVDEIVWSHINEETVGKIVIYYELLTSVSGALLEVNTYDQPGVELGKQILASYFKH